MIGKVGLFVLIAIGLLFSQCNEMKGNSFVPAPADYVSDKHTRVLLKRPLREISGIDFISESELIAVNDEAGKIFYLNPENGEHRVFEFGKKGDYEDVVKVNDKFYVLNSVGSLYVVSAQSNKQEAVFAGDFGKHMEFESLCYDQERNQLLLICKECGKMQRSIIAYSFNLSDNSFSPEPFFSVSWDEIRRMGKDNSIECRPSAAAINPVNKKLYIIAFL